jgi:hypothetical protein
VRSREEGSSSVFVDCSSLVEVIKEVRGELAALREE